MRLAVRTPYPVGDVNCHLLRGDPLTLVDTGPKTAAALADLRAGLERAGTRLERIEQVLITHHHADHAGLARTLQRDFGCAIVGHELLSEYLDDVSASRAAEVAYHVEVMRLHGVPEAVVVSYRDHQDGLYDLIDSVELDAALPDGATVIAGGRPLTLVWRPGHSRTDTLFLEGAGGEGFVGDHLLAHTSSNPSVTRPPHGPRDPRERESTLIEYRAALMQTACLDIGVLHPGHGESIDDHRALVARRLRQHDRNVERVLRVLAPGPATAHEIARSIWGEKALARPYATLSMVLGSLDLALRDGRVLEQDADPVISYRR